MDGAIKDREIVVNASAADKYQWMFVARQARTVYYRKDFIDYTLMCLANAGLMAVSFGLRHPLTWLSAALCQFMVVSFARRHGIAMTTPLILKQPQDALYMAVYKLRNIRPVWFIAAALLAAENLFIHLTPSLPHHTDLMRTIGTWFLAAHFIALTLYRTAVLIAHLRKTELIREILMQTSWRKSIDEKTNMTWEVFHAYFTGVLAHIVMLAPSFLVLRYAEFSVLALPVTLVLNVFLYVKWGNTFNDWFYRDHWLGHNSEFEFIYLHGPHHDAIPSGLIGCSGNGFVEGFFRQAMGSPMPFYNPTFAALSFSLDVIGDIDMHQYIPGVFPRMTLEDLHAIHHSVHHYGRIEPYSFGVKFDHPSVSDAYRKKNRFLPEQMKNSIRLDEEMNGFDWNNPTFRQLVSLYEKYHDA